MADVPAPLALEVERPAGDRPLVESRAGPGIGIRRLPPPPSEDRDCAAGGEPERGEASGGESDPDEGAPARDGVGGDDQSFLPPSRADQLGSVEGGTLHERRCPVLRAHGSPLRTSTGALRARASVGPSLIRAYMPDASPATR